MKERRIFADPTLPFHVWVRESDAAGPRWVLREASTLASPRAPNREPGACTRDAGQAD